MSSDTAQEDYRRIGELLWGERTGPTRGPKPSLSVEQVVRAGVAVADAEGLEAVSMQRVARECGVTTMALYRYVPGKAELIALMLDIGLGAAPHLSEVPGGWRPRLEEWARQLWAIFHQHPWSLVATAPLRPMGPNELGWFETAVGALAESGLPARDVVQAVIAVLLHVRGMAGFADHVRGMAWFADNLRTHRERFPALTATEAEGAFAPPAGETNSLDIGLSLLLDGISNRIAERETRQRAHI